MALGRAGRTDASLSSMRGVFGRPAVPRLAPGSYPHAPETLSAPDQAANADLKALGERQREIEQMVEVQPEEMAALLRGWLASTR